MLNMLTNSFKAYSNAGSALIAEIEDQNIKSELFFKEIENWRNIENNYINKLTHLVNNLRDKNHRILPKELPSSSHQNQKIENKKEQLRPFCASFEFSKLINVIMDSHKSLMSKVNFDIVMVNLQNSEKLIQQNKKLLDEQKQLLKDILSKKEMVQKTFGKKEKLRKQKEEEEMCQIFMSDSIDITIDQKMRKKTKIKEVEKELQQYDIKIKEIIEDYRLLYQQEKEHLSRIKYNCKEQKRTKRETLLKMHLHLTTYWKNLNAQVQELKIAQDEQNPCYHQNLFNRMEKKEEDVIKKLGSEKIGFVQNSLKLINQNLIDELIQYTKDKDIKNKIKRIMETNEVDPAETDQSCRQVKLIKKILAMENVECECMSIFRGIINKTAKLRLNFVFIMQFFRINNQFEITGQRMYSVFCLISQFLEASYESRDSFALKQLMILLMTYYVSHPNPNGQNTKIYIIHFFKKHPLWKDIEYWQSILIECIYLQKKNTIKMMIISEYGNLHRKKELLEAERSAILNQMLIVVRNMIIFDYTEKEVKAFASRFIKLLKQDQKFQKDSTIEEAAKEESKLLQQQKNEIKNFYKLTFIRQKQQEYNIPIDMRNSYIQ